MRCLYVGSLIVLVIAGSSGPTIASHPTQAFPAQAKESTAHPGLGGHLHPHHTNGNGKPDAGVVDDAETVKDLIAKLQAKILELRTLSSVDSCPPANAAALSTQPPAPDPLSDNVTPSPLACEPQPCVPQPCVPQPCVSRPCTRQPCKPQPCIRAKGDDDEQHDKQGWLAWVGSRLFWWANWWNFSFLYLMWMVAFFTMDLKIETLVPSVRQVEVDPELKDSLFEKHKAKTAKAVNSAWRKAHSKGGGASETESAGRATPHDSPAFKGERWADPSPRGSPKESSTSDPSEEYVIRVTTASEKRSGSDGTVRIVLHGAKRTSEEIPLRKSETHKDKFERGQTDVFRVNLADVGYVQAVTVHLNWTHHTIGHHILHNEWRPDHIEVLAPDGNSFVFKCDAVLTRRHPTKMFYISSATAPEPVDLPESFSLIEHTFKNESGAAPSTVPSTLDDQDALASDIESTDDEEEENGPRIQRMSTTYMEDDDIAVKPLTPVKSSNQ